ncbi:MAG: zinc ribbon domain-containing protein [Clostridiales bacterium]|nr:zinc ribbon domain-containing protein [Clostridiales bacterium]
MFCMNCGSELSDNAKFCMNCGTKVIAPVKREDFFEEQDKQAEETRRQEIQTKENRGQEPEAVQEESEIVADDFPEEEDDLAGMTIKKEKIGNKARTGFNRKVLGNEDLQSYQVEPEDIAKLIGKYIIPQYADDPKGLKKLEAVVMGKGVVAGNRRIESKDGRWTIVTYYMGKAGSRASLDITNSAYIYLTDHEKNIRYQYGALTMSKFKKAAKGLFK